MNMRRTSLLLLSAACLLPLAACQTTANSSAASTNQRVDTALTNAANEASAEGNNTESLAFLERLYKRDSSNVQSAVKYASALRDNGRLNRAAIVLAPFVEGEHAVKNADVYTEYASTQAAMGNYVDAEKYAREAVLLAPNSGQAYHVLGIALEAQGYHPQAEVAFRKALDNWQGDPVPVLNNLGLNLAAQGFIDEGIETLRKAAAAAPDRTDIERNLRIVSALQGLSKPKTGPQAPTPKHKPDHDKAAQAEAATKKAMETAAVPVAITPPAKTETVKMEAVKPEPVKKEALAKPASAPAKAPAKTEASVAPASAEPAPAKAEKPKDHYNG